MVLSLLAIARSPGDLPASLNLRLASGFKKKQQNPNPTREGEAQSENIASPRKIKSADTNLEEVFNAPAEMIRRIDFVETGPVCT